MKRKLGSIKFRIAAVAVVFTLASVAVTAFISLRQFRQAARQNLLQSTEFNLNLVAGLVSRDLDSLYSLQSWCRADSTVSAYIAGTQGGAAAGTRAFDRMNEQAHYNRAYQYLLRLVAVSNDRQRILQTGTGSTSGVPLSPYTIGRLESLETAQSFGRWAGVVSDPFIDQNGPPILYSRGTVLNGGKDAAAAGDIFLLVSSSILTDPVANYQLPDGCQLYLTIGGETFSLNGALSPTEASAAYAPTGDETFSPGTKIVQFTQDGEDMLAVGCPVGGTGLWLSQTISPQAMGVNLRSLYGFQLLLLCFCTSFIGAMVLWVLDRSISRPIQRLQARMAIVSEGDFSTDPAIEWDNELGDVGRGVNHLAQSVQKLMDRRLADEKARQDLEYQMLQSQINPHFLYNSLNSIKWMATIQNAHGIAEMTTALAHLLKNAAKGRQVLIPLGEELSILRDYFKIQEYRYGGGIALQEDIPPGTEEALLPRFTLQPLLENAIFHGIEPKGGAGIVTLSARHQAEELILTMEDNGVGMDVQAAQALLAGQEGGQEGMFQKIGINNVHRRIQYEFGPPYGLSIESVPGSFTRITVRLPFTAGQQEEQEDAP